MQPEATRPEEAACIGATQAVVPDRRTVLAAIRTNLALDRTLLAWVRTALSMMAAGVAFDQVRACSTRRVSRRVPHYCEAVTVFVSASLLRVPHSSRSRRGHISKAIAR